MRRMTPWGIMEPYAVLAGPADPPSGLRDREGKHQTVNTPFGEGVLIIGIHVHGGLTA